jgi:hypothetical protein
MRQLQAEGKSSEELREFSILRELRLSLAWLHIHGLVTDKERLRLKMRLEKRVKAARFTMALIEGSLP